PGFRRAPTNASVSAAARPARRMRSIWAGLRISIGIVRPDVRGKCGLRPMPIRSRSRSRSSGAIVVRRPPATLPGGACRRQSGTWGRSEVHYFVAVAGDGHVGRAPQRLYVAQPAVSRQIRALEDEIGTPLFTRAPRGMQLLPPGRVFLDRARAILVAVEEAANA